jgi:hypothetical protein
MFHNGSSPLPPTVLFSGRLQGALQKLTHKSLTAKAILSVKSITSYFSLSSLYHMNCVCLHIVISLRLLQEFCVNLKVFLLYCKVLKKLTNCFANS